MMTSEEVEKEYPGLPYSEYVWIHRKLEVKHFFIRLLRKIKGLPASIFWSVLDFLRNLIIDDPIPLKKDAKRGVGLLWWAVAIARSMLCPFALFSPVAYVREALGRKRWWDNMTGGQQHYFLEEQRRLMEGILEASEKLMVSLAKGDPKLEKKTKKILGKQAAGKEGGGDE